MEKLKKRRLGVFNVDIEGTIKQVIRFYPRWSSRSDTKPRRETFKKNRMIIDQCCQKQQTSQEEGDK